MLSVCCCFQLYELTVTPQVYLKHQTQSTVVPHTMLPTGFLETFDSLFRPATQRCWMLDVWHRDVTWSVWECHNLGEWWNTFRQNLHRAAVSNPLVFSWEWKVPDYTPTLPLLWGLLSNIFLSHIPYSQPNIMINNNECNHLICNQEKSSPLSV